MQVEQFAAAQQKNTTSFPAFFQNFLKTVGTLRVKETTLTSRNAFIFKIFTLEREK